MAPTIRGVGQLVGFAALIVGAAFVIATSLGLVSISGGGSGDDPRYLPLAAPDKLGGFPRWHGMVSGEQRDARAFARRFHAAAIEAAYLPPGLDPLLASAFRARDHSIDLGGTPYGKVRCTSLGAFVECYRISDELTVNVLAPKAMHEQHVATLVTEFWDAQRPQEQ
ncbi:MAG: hypothetical protein ABJA81_09935 [Nocardioidaceae bacterium]